MGSVIVEKEKKVLPMADYIKRKTAMEDFERSNEENPNWTPQRVKTLLLRQPAADVAPVRHGRWILEAHDERVNYRWNVTAECSECCDEQKEIWAGFFPGVPPCIARDAALVSAESVKLSNYCPNCGAKMDGGGGDAAD